MAIEVNELIAMRDRLIESIAKGVRVLQMGAERVEYQSFAEMNRALADLEARIARASGTPRPTVARFTSSKGF